jgi:iron complex transport system ATP-binding protein
VGVVIQVEDLNYKSILKQISLHFQPGHLYGIIGPNGAGKTTLLRHLTGRLTPDAGRVMVMGRNLSGYERAEVGRLISVVPQSPTISFPFSCYDLVAMGRYPHGDRDAAIIQRSLQEVDAWHLRKCPIDEISAGERQRVFLARSLATESPILLLDEPSSHLDLGHKQQTWTLLKRLVGESRVLIATTHDLSVVEDYADQVVLLSDGMIKGQGEPKELLTPETVAELFALPCL